MARPNLSKEKIIDAAIGLADDEGLDAVTLRGLAKRLHVHVTSLYNHIPTKEALLVDMNKALMEETDLPSGSLTWQDWIRGYAAAIQALAQRRNWSGGRRRRGRIQPADGSRLLGAGW